MVCYEIEALKANSKFLDNTIITKPTPFTLGECPETPLILKKFLNSSKRPSKGIQMIYHGNTLVPIYILGSME